MGARARGRPPRRADRRLRAATGAGETDPTAGGFLVPESFAAELLGAIYEDRSSVLPYFMRLNIPDGSNTLRIAGADETSRVNGYRWGGVIADFVDEGATETPSFPKVKSTLYSSNKIIGYVPVSNELLADAANLEIFLRRAFKDELSYKLDQYALSSAGTGAGRPLSILNSPALVTVAKTSGQTAGTLTSANLRAMWAAMPCASRRRAIWAISEGVTQLPEVPVEITYPQAGCANPTTALARWDAQ